MSTFIPAMNAAAILMKIVCYLKKRWFFTITGFFG